MRGPGVVRWLVLILPILLPSAGRAQGVREGDDMVSRLGLADLAAYRAALSGRATIDDARAAEPPRSVSFRQLWDTPDDWLGRRVQVSGRVARVFRQEALGSFPPLVEAWVSTPAGDLFCTVFPAHGETKVGQSVDFTGTFLKSICYSGSDQPRLAPLIVGDRPPKPVSESAAVEQDRSLPVAASGSPAQPGWWRSAIAWSLGLLAALAAAGLLAWRHVRPVVAVGAGSGQYVGPPGTASSTAGDPPLEFIEREQNDGTELS